MELELASFEQAVALKPDHAQTHPCRDDAMLDLKRTEEALSGFGRALALQPK